MSVWRFGRSLAVLGRFLFPTAAAQGKLTNTHTYKTNFSVSMPAVSGSTCSVDCHQMKIVLKGI